MDTSGVVLIPHVVHRAQRRGITLEQILSTVTEPDIAVQTYPNAKTGALRKRHLKTIDGKRLCVVVEYKGHIQVAITAYWKR